MSTRYIKWDQVWSINVATCILVVDCQGLLFGRMPHLNFIICWSVHLRIFMFWFAFAFHWFNIFDGIKLGPSSLSMVGRARMTCIKWDRLSSILWLNTWHNRTPLWVKQTPDKLVVRHLTQWLNFVTRTSYCLTCGYQLTHWFTWEIFW